LSNQADSIETGFRETPHHLNDDAISKVSRYEVIIIRVRKANDWSDREDVYIDEKTLPIVRYIGYVSFTSFFLKWCRSQASIFPRRRHEGETNSTQNQPITRITTRKTNQKKNRMISGQELISSLQSVPSPTDNAQMVFRIVWPVMKASSEKGKGHTSHPSFNREKKRKARPGDVNAKIQQCRTTMQDKKKRRSSTHYEQGRRKGIPKKNLQNDHLDNSVRIFLFVWLHH